MNPNVPNPQNSEADPRGRSNYSDRKREAILHTFSEPVWPKLAKLLYYSLLVLTPALAAAEIVSFFRYSRALGLPHLLRNLSTTCFFLWCVYSFFLILACLCGMRAAAAGYWKRKQESGLADQTEEEHARSLRAVRRLYQPYQLYLRVSLTGLAVWFALWIFAWLAVR